MKEKIKIPIKNVILSKDNIIGLSKCISKQKDIRRISFNIKFMNDQEIESDDIIIFENEKFSEYEIKAIHMSYYDNEYIKNIEIWIYNYEKYSGSYIEISYENENNLDWLAITEKDFKEQLSYCNKRKNIISIMQNDTILFLIIFILNVFATAFLGRLISEIFTLSKEVTYAMVAGVFSLLLCISIYWRDLFYKAFPIVEIDIQEKSNSAKRARKKLEFVLLTFVIPFILDVIYSIAKRIIGIN